MLAIEREYSTRGAPGMREKLIKEDPMSPKYTGASWASGRVNFTVPNL